MMNCIASILFLLIGSYFGLAAELVSSNYQFGDLRLQYLPPDNDGGEQVSILLFFAIILFSCYINTHDMTTSLFFSLFYADY